MVDGFAGAVLDALLRGEHPVLAALRTQSAAASVRTIETSELGLWIDLWVDESGETDTEHGCLAAIYPELGVHFWLNGRTRLTASGAYYGTTEGRDADVWVFGLGVAWLLGDE